MGGKRKGEGGGGKGCGLREGCSSCNGGDGGGHSKETRMMGRIWGLSIFACKASLHGFQSVISWARSGLHDNYVVHQIELPQKHEKDAFFLLTIGSFLLAVELFYLQSCLGAFFLQLDLLLTVGALLFLANNVKVDLRSTLTDCKQRNPTISKTTPTVSKQIPSNLSMYVMFFRCGALPVVLRDKQR